jgi:hypothetical protein
MVSIASKLAKQANKGITDPKAERWTVAHFFDVDGVYAKDATDEQARRFITKVGGTSELSKAACLGLAKVFGIAMPRTAKKQERIQEFLDGKPCKYVSLFLSFCTA